MSQVPFRLMVFCELAYFHETHIVNVNAEIILLLSHTIVSSLKLLYELLRNS